MAVFNVKPKVRFIAETIPDKHAMAEYLRDMGYDNATVIRWDNIPSPTLNDLIEFMGRLCYASFDASRNENLTRVRSDQRAYLGNILESRHGSVLEHAQVSFVIENCSRVFTHELVRHRVGVAISQESMRYVRLDAWNFVYPGAFFDEKIPYEVRQELALRSENLNTMIQNEVNYMTSLLDLDTMDFGRKKRYTSALRKWLPNGIATQMGWSANIHTLRHVINMRTDDAAEEEMRAVAEQIAVICVNRYPYLFQDFTYDASTYEGDAGVWKSKYA